MFIFCEIAFVVGLPLFAHSLAGSRFVASRLQARARGPVWRCSGRVCRVSPWRPRRTWLSAPPSAGRCLALASASTTLPHAALSPHSSPIEKSPSPCKTTSGAASALQLWHDLAGQADCFCASAVLPIEYCCMFRMGSVPESASLKKGQPEYSNFSLGKLTHTMNRANSAPSHAGSEHHYVHMPFSKTEY